MKEFKGRTAVITGASSGIGLGLATRFAAEGMNVVMADIERVKLDAAAKAVGANGARVRAVTVDVANPDSVAELATAAIADFGRVHVVCANAGVATYGSVWEQSMDDWKWTLGVNLWGVIHTLRAFIPDMIAHGEDGHIVVTSSAAGLLATTSSSYAASKYAVLGISEGLAADLAGTRIGVSVLCPGGVKTGIFQSERNRPRDLPEHGVHRPEIASWVATLAAPDRKDQVSPAYIADQVLRAIQDNELYIMPSQRAHREPIRQRLQRMLDKLATQPTSDA